MSYHSSIEQSCSCSLLSGCATTTGRLLGPKMTLGVFLKDKRRATTSGVEPRFSTFQVKNTKYNKDKIYLFENCIKGLRKNFSLILEVCNARSGRGLGFRYSFICQGTSTRRQRSDHFGLWVKLPSVTIRLTTQR